MKGMKKHRATNDSEPVTRREFLAATSGIAAVTMGLASDSVEAAEVGLDQDKLWTMNITSDEVKELIQEPGKFVRKRHHKFPKPPSDRCISCLVLFGYQFDRAHFFRKRLPTDFVLQGIEGTIFLSVMPPVPNNDVIDKFPRPGKPRIDITLKQGLVYLHYELGTGQQAIKNVAYLAASPKRFVSQLTPDHFEIHTREIVNGKPRSIPPLEFAPLSNQDLHSFRFLQACCGNTMPQCCVTLGYIGDDGKAHIHDLAAKCY